MRKHGYTLIETLVYSVIIALILVAVVGSIFSVYKNFAKLRVDRRLSQNGDVAMERILRTVRESAAVDLGQSTFNLTPGALQVDSTKFYLDGQALKVEENGGPAQNLTSDADVTSLIFYRQSTSTPSQIIKIEFSLSAGEGQFLKTKNFYGSAVMRGAY